jgi:hypothetical protein
MQNTNGYNWTEVISIKYQNSSRWQASISDLLTIHPIRDTDQDRIGHRLGYARLVGSLLGNLRLKFSQQSARSSKRSGEVGLWIGLSDDCPLSFSSLPPSGEHVS